MKLIEKNENQLSFTAEISEPLANSIRRYVNHIPILAVDEVEISKNDSPLYDETIAHRIGLVPLNSEKVSAKKLPSIKLSSDGEGMVYSKSLKGTDIVYGEMPLTFLNKGQELELKATTKLGRGEEHSKFSPGFIFYRNVAEISAEKSLGDEIRKACRGNEIREKGEKIIVTDNMKKSVQDICEGIAKRHGKKIEVSWNGELVVTLESFGQIPAGEIFTESIGELKKDLNEVLKKI
jgi:DNA-directed RNA polymerase subunit D